ncbi:MAG: hypothetical protein V4621_07710 [Pseudomonadota bacterium]
MLNGVAIGPGVSGYMMHDPVAAPPLTEAHVKQAQERHAQRRYGGLEPVLQEV